METTKIETTNYFMLRTILGYSKSVSYDFLLNMADIKSFEKRRQFQSSVMLYRRILSSLYDKGAPYISECFLILRIYRTTYVGLAQGWIYLSLIWSLCINPLHF